MDTDLLATKLLIPPLMRHAVPRARLYDALEQGIPESRLVMISAPAGYGKTTLLAQWAGATHLPVAWLTISETDNDIEQFFRYLLNAWETVRPGIREQPAGLLLGGMSPEIDAVLRSMIHAANDSPEHVVFVLDDYHLVKEPAIHDALDFLLDHAPPTLHFVLAGREDPPLSLARYRARHELLELRGEDLQFGPGETRGFLNEGMGLDLGEGEAESLNAQLEGWIAGLQLVALTLRHRPEHGEPLEVSGRHRHVADYLSEEVLASLSEETRTFLLQTSILDRLSESLCIAVTGNQQSQEMLESLERNNLFLMPLDDSRTWFRYHRLFAGFLQETLHRRLPGEVDGIHRRAAGWYLAHDQPDSAFQHAVDGDDLELVVRIFDSHVNAKLWGGELRVVKRWLDALPAAWRTAYPVLDLAQAGFLAYSGAFEACVRCVDDVEQRLALAESEEARWQLARVTTIRCFIACIQNDLTGAEVLADRALQDLPEENLGFRPGIYAALGDLYRQNARWAEAKQCYLQALDFMHAPAIRVQSAHLFGALADLDVRQGRLRNAAAYWEKALAVIQERESWGHVALPVIGWVYLRMSELLYEWNELAEARQNVPRGLERAELGGDPQARIAGNVIMARLELTGGNVDSAEEHLEQARMLLDEAPFPDWIGRFERCRVDLWLAQNTLRSAVTWCDTVLKEDSESQPLSEVTRLTVARVLIHRGDPEALEQADRLLHRLISTADELGQSGVKIEALAMRSMIHEKRGDQPGMLTDLEQALRLAEPEGYVRLFADLGLPMARVLQEARNRGVMADSVTRLLAAFDDDAVGDSLAEPLSPREHDVLMLMAAGLSNREIADSLYVSPETIKKHTGNIYGKLGVRGRIEAVTKAKSLALID